MVRRTKADAQTTRSALLDAAELLFDDRGVSRTSLADIAKCAGTTRGAIYWHFADKAALFDAMIDRATEALTGGPSAEPLRTPDIAEVCRGLLAALEGIATRPHLRRVMRIAIHRVEYVGELGGAQARHLSSHREWMARSERALVGAFAALAQAPRISSARAAIGLQALVEGLLQAWLLDPEAFDLVETARECLANWLRGMGLDDTGCASKACTPGDGSSPAGSYAEGKRLDTALRST